MNFSIFTYRRTVLAKTPAFEVLSVWLPAPCPLLGPHFLFPRLWNAGWLEVSTHEVCAATNASILPSASLATLTTAPASDSTGGVAGRSEEQQPPTLPLPSLSGSNLWQLSTAPCPPPGCDFFLHADHQGWLSASHLAAPRMTLRKGRWRECLPCRERGCRSRQGTCTPLCSPPHRGHSVGQRFKRLAIGPLSPKVPTSTFLPKIKSSLFILIHICLQAAFFSGPGSVCSY